MSAFPSRLPPALLVRSAAEARAAHALAGGAGLLLLSPPGAAGLHGPAWWRALAA
ncbi:hypothetical protein HEQ75_21995, partial [Roseomonas sp. BU-1]|nr:hypothetical protein [Falsiroseomonas selenitidurans]